MQCTDQGENIEQSMLRTITLSCTVTIFWSHTGRASAAARVLFSHSVHS